MVNILSVLQSFYSEWNVQVFVLFSLLLQVILIMVAPVRKITSKGSIILLIWVAYLLADWTATFTIGLISKRRGQVQKPGDDPPEILAFWAPFLLLHLGGPDTVTAFSLEDNALWRRHLFDFITQVATASVVFLQAFSGNKLRVSTFLLFGAGTIKYLERTCALFLANLDTFRKSMLQEPDPGLNYTKLMQVYASKKDANLPTQIKLIPEPNKGWRAERYAMDEDKLDDLAVVRHAYHFFMIFKGLFVDLIFSSRERDESRVFFLKRYSQDALKVLEVELNFLYDVLYTKIAVVHSAVGLFFRFVSFCSVGAALSFFYAIDKHGFRKIDIEITYSLLCGAIILDAIALLRHFLSDWTIAYFQKISRKNNWGGYVSQAILVLLQFFHTSEIIKKRWSRCLATYNLIDYCLKERRGSWIYRFYHYLIKFKFLKVVGHLDDSIKNLYDSIKYISKEPLEDTLWDFIFHQLIAKSHIADDSNIAERIYSARGDWVLMHHRLMDKSSTLMSYIVGVDYDQSLIIWHIATNLCYEIDDLKNSDKDVHCEISKILSEYMLYLLVMQPTMMSTVAGIGEIRFRNTCAEVKEFFSRKVPRREAQQKERKQACEAIYEVNTDVKPIDLKGDRSKSVLFDGCILAKELRKMEKNDRWKLMSEVWVELLSYAASHCRPNAHAAQLSKGGELITFVWLLMAHLGFGNQFQINDGDARAKLIVGK